MSVAGPSRRRLIAGAALLALAPGCTTTPPPKLFTLAARPGTPTPHSPGSVMVRTVELAKYLDRPQIVRYGTPYELEVSEFERWGEGMRDMVTRVFVENLSMRLPSSQVFAGSGPLTMRADATVETEINRFEADPDGTVI